MSHLILPIDIDGTKYCPTYESGRMTTGVLTSFEVLGTNYAEITTPESPWKLAVLPIGDIAGDGEVSFGVACGSIVLINFTSQDTSTAPHYAVLISIYVNGVLIVAPFYLFNYDPDALGVEIDLLDVPCGSIVTLVASATRADLVPGDTDGVLTVTAEVTSIT